jgi:hypothetical protein
MKRTILLASAALLLVLGGNNQASAENTIIVPQDGAPLKVLRYVAEFDTKDKKPLVEHTVKYQNATQKRILAARFGVLEYNGYNEKIDAFVGYTLEDSDKGEKDSAEFINEAPHAVFFKKYGTGYLWVDAVRYADGTLWKVDRTQLLAEVKKLVFEITEADLVEKKSLPAD